MTSRLCPFCPFISTSISLWRGSDLPAGHPCRVFRHETMTEPRRASAAALFLLYGQPLLYIKWPPFLVLWGAAKSTQMNKRHLNFYLAHAHTSRLFRLRLSLTCAVGKSPSQPPPRRAHREHVRQHFPFTAVPDVRGGTSSS